MSFFVYVLSSTKGSTYVGATVDLDHRLRQHNNEIKGGARATTSKVKQGETWTRICHIRGFPDWRAALQFEWRLKQLSRKLSSPPHMKPVERRIKALIQLLSLERPTSKSIPFSEWTSKPEPVFETLEADELFTKHSHSSIILSFLSKNATIENDSTREKEPVSLYCNQVDVPISHLPLDAPDRPSL